MLPHRQQPTSLPHPWDSPGKNTGVGCHFLLQHMKVKSKSEVAQSCPILSDLMDCSPPGSSVHGIFQARVLEWGAIALSGSEWLVFCNCGFSLSALWCSLSAYHLTWVSLTLDVGCLFTAAPINLLWTSKYVLCGYVIPWASLVV